MTDLSNADPNSFLGTGISGGQIGTGLGIVGTAANTLGNYIQGTSNAAASRAEAEGLGIESQAYSTAAGYAEGNVDLAKESTTIQQYQEQIRLAKTIGKQQAEVGAAGFGNSGSALYLLRSSLAQGALAKGLIGVQGEIQEQSYAAQASADRALSAQATAAQKAAEASASSQQSAAGVGAIGGIAGIAKGLFSLFA